MLWRSLLYVALCEVAAGEWLPHTLVGHNLTADGGPYSKLIFDPVWGSLGRVILLPATLQIVEPCSVPACTNCTVSFAPDPRLWFFPVDASLAPGQNISLSLEVANNTGPELLTPEATVYVPPRGCRPPLIVSYGGAWVNVCATTPFVIQFFYGQWPTSGPSSPWCFTPGFSTHILRLDTLEWAHLPEASTGPASPDPVALNLSGVFGLGVFASYDSARDRVLLLGGFRSNPANDADLAMDMSVLAGCSSNSDSAAPGVETEERLRRQRGQPGQQKGRGQWRGLGYHPEDTVRWSSGGPLPLNRLQWEHLGLTSGRVMSFGAFSIDPIRDRAVQFGGVDFLYWGPSATCSVIDFSQESVAWSDVDSCSYLSAFGPFFVWGAATVTLPALRRVLYLGGRETQPDGSRATRFATADAHWALDLDTLTWENLAPERAFWGLPLLTGASAAAAPLPDGSTAVYVWGGIGCGDPANPLLQWRAFQCGQGVRAHLAYPAFFGEGAVGVLYHVVLPPPAPPLSPPAAAAAPAISSLGAALSLAATASALLAIAAAHCALLVRSRCCKAVDPGSAATVQPSVELADSDRRTGTLSASVVAAAGGRSSEFGAASAASAVSSEFDAPTRTAALRRYPRTLGDGDEQPAAATLRVGGLQSDGDPVIRRHPASVRRTATSRTAEEEDEGRSGFTAAPASQSAATVVPYPRPPPHGGSTTDPEPALHYDSVEHRAASRVGASTATIRGGPPQHLPALATTSAGRQHTLASSEASHTGAVSIDGSLPPTPRGVVQSGADALAVLPEWLLCITAGAAAVIHTILCGLAAALLTPPATSAAGCACAAVAACAGAAVAVQHAPPWLHSLFFRHCAGRVFCTSTLGALLALVATTAALAAAGFTLYCVQQAQALPSQPRLTPTVLLAVACCDAAAALVLAVDLAAVALVGRAGKERSAWLAALEARAEARAAARRNARLQQRRALASRAAAAAAASETSGMEPLLRAETAQGSETDPGPDHAVASALGALFGAEVGSASGGPVTE